MKPLLELTVKLVLFTLTGVYDNVCCFTCDGGIRNWESSDDPWIQHCRLFPDCPYVRQQMDEDIIALVRATYEEIDNINDVN